MKIWRIEIDLCMIAQGYKYTLWAHWLSILPSPFCWFGYEQELEEYLK